MRSGPCVALAIALLGPACHTERARVPPPPAPVVARPQDAIPGDLDLVVRIDLARARSALGESAVDALRRNAEAGMSEGSAEGRMLSEALLRADTAWIALRPGLPAELTDSVVVLEGRYRDFDPGASQGGAIWDHPTDLGGFWDLYSRPTPKRRSAVERVYVHHPNLVVLVSPAEVDSAERAIELGAGDAHVEPPSRGLISFEARARAVARSIRDRAPAAARLIDRAARLRGHADVGAAGLLAEVEIEFDSAAAAREAAAAIEIVARAAAEERGLVGLVARAVSVTAVGRTAVARVSLDRAGLSLLVRCAADERTCGVTDVDPTPAAEQPGDPASRTNP
jgi:hypothetical protein